MKYFLITIIFLFSFETFADDKINSKVIEISKNLRCLVCQGQSINDSDSDFALDVKKLVKKNWITYTKENGIEYNSGSKLNHKIVNKIHPVKKDLLKEFLVSYLMSGKND